MAKREKQSAKPREPDMSKIGISYAELKALNPCSDSLKRVAKLMGGAKAWSGKIDASTARENGATFGDVVWVASALARADKDIERRLRLWMADCAARVLHIYERDYPADDRPRNAIITARQFARGEIDAAARAAAWAAARDAAWDAAWGAARGAAWDAARAAAWDAAWDAAWGAEEAWQFNRLILWLSDNEPADYSLPARNQEAA